MRLYKSLFMRSLALVLMVHMTLVTSEFASAADGFGPGRIRLPVGRPITPSVAPVATTPVAVAPTVVSIAPSRGLQIRPVSGTPVSPSIIPVATHSLMQAPVSIPAAPVAAAPAPVAPVSAPSQGYLLSQNTWLAYLFPYNTGLAAQLAAAPSPSQLQQQQSSLKLQRDIADFGDMPANSRTRGEQISMGQQQSQLSSLSTYQTLLNNTKTYGPQLASYLSSGQYNQAFSYAEAHGLMVFLEQPAGFQLLGVAPFNPSQMSSFYAAASNYWNGNILGLNPNPNWEWGDPGHLMGDAVTNSQTAGDNTYPDLSRFAGKRPSKGGILGEVLLVVAAVVATVFTAGAASAALGPALGAALGTSTAVGGAIAGAAASTLVSTAFSVAEGQPLGKAFEGALVSSAVGGFLGGTDVGDLTDSSIANGAIDGAIGGAANGLVNGGNLGKAILGGALGGGIGAGLAPGLDSIDNGNQEITKGVSGAIAGAASSAATGQNIIIGAAQGAAGGVAQGAESQIAQNAQNQAQAQQDITDYINQTNTNKENAYSAGVPNPDTIPSVANSEAATTYAIASSGLQASGVSFDGTSDVTGQDQELDPIQTTAQKLPVPTTPRSPASVDPLSPVNVTANYALPAGGFAEAMGISGTNGSAASADAGAFNTSLSSDVNGLIGTASGTVAAGGILGTTTGTGSGASTASDLNNITFNATTPNSDYDAVDWKTKSVFGNTVVYDPAVGTNTQNSYIRYSLNQANNVVDTSYLSVEMLRGDPARPGIGNYLLNYMAESNPGVPVYSELAKTNLSSFNNAFLNLANSGEPITADSLAGAFQSIPAISSLPGEVTLIPSYATESGGLVSMSILRNPDLTTGTVTVTNAGEVLSDPRFQSWLDSLPSRSPADLSGASLDDIRVAAAAAPATTTVDAAAGAAASELSLGDLAGKVGTGALNVGGRLLSGVGDVTLATGAYQAYVDTGTADLPAALQAQSAITASITNPNASTSSKIIAAIGAADDPISPNYDGGTYGTGLRVGSDTIATDLNGGLLYKGASAVNGVVSDVASGIGSFLSNAFTVTGENEMTSEGLTVDSDGPTTPQVTTQPVSNIQPVIRVPTNIGGRGGEGLMR